MIVVTGNDREFSSDEKRFYTPHEVRFSCPECGSETTRDCRDWYFSYPVFNSEFELTLHCMACDHEWPTRAVLRLALVVSPVQSDSDPGKIVPGSGGSERGD